MRLGSKALHFVTRHKKFQYGSILRLFSGMVNMRLLWTLQNIPELVEAFKNGSKHDILFGTLDTWLLYKLSGDKKIHITNISNAAGTGKPILVYNFCH